LCFRSSFFHVKSLAAPYYRLKSTKPLFWSEDGTGTRREGGREEKMGRLRLRGREGRPAATNRACEEGL